MSKYIVKRLLIGLITLFGITVIDYALINLIGDPVRMMAGPKSQCCHSRNKG
jgi:ABC-type dipeptide/oligopeptide/nickel transport system permease component